MDVANAANIKHTEFRWEIKEQRDHWENPRHIWGDVRLDLRKRGWSSMAWIHLAQVRDQKRDLLKKVLKLRFP
jgi:hypothetical protein